MRGDGTQLAFWLLTPPCDLNAMSTSAAPPLALSTRVCDPRCGGDHTPQGCRGTSHDRGVCNILLIATMLVAPAIAGKDFVSLVVGDITPNATSVESPSVESRPDPWAPVAFANLTLDCAVTISGGSGVRAHGIDKQASTPSPPPLGAARRLTFLSSSTSHTDGLCWSRMRMRRLAGL